MGRLQRTDLPAISDAACRATYSDTHYWEWLKEDMICAGDLVWIRIKYSFSSVFSSLKRWLLAWVHATVTLAVASWMETRLFASFSTFFQIVGITSWEARGCGHPEHPGVFLQVILKLPPPSPRFHIFLTGLPPTLHQWKILKSRTLVLYLTFKLTWPLSTDTISCPI